jgi:succinoglycan biosynthesis protein ExoA
MSSALPATAVIIPALNEERYIIPCLESLLADPPACLHQIIVVDGGSTDRTVELVRDMARRRPGLSLLHNPRRLQAAAVNLAAHAAAAEVGVLLRADAHCLYPPNFIHDCVAALVARNAASVVVPLRTEGRRGLQRAIAAAQNSRLGNGGAAHRIGATDRYVEHGHHAAFDRAAFLRIGGYDETFSHNEDAEFDYRLTRAGGRIWMARCGVRYFPRSSLWRLARQYLRHGAGRARTIRLHRMRPRLRQLLPLAMLLALLASLALIPLSPLFAAIPLGYLLVATLWGGVVAIRGRDPWLLAMGGACLVMHMAWAIGFLSCWLRRPVRHRATAGPRPVLAARNGMTRE